MCSAERRVPAVQPPVAAVHHLGAGVLPGGQTVGATLSQRLLGRGGLRPAEGSCGGAQGGGRGTQ